MEDNKKAQQRYQNMVNSARGQNFEKFIEGGCAYYKNHGLAEISKTPEPFKVTKKHARGLFTGRFIKKAEPDFKGTLRGGRAICFEAKYTSKDRIKRSVLTKEQMEKLEYHEALGAVAGVVAGIDEDFFFIPWGIWRDMKAHFGRQYIEAADVEQYRIRFNGALMFLDYINAKNTHRKRVWEVC